MKKSVTGALVPLMVLLWSGTAWPVQVSGGEVCNTLVAGQNIDAGTVCTYVEGDSLVVEYTTTGGWELTEAHLWVGTSLTDMPQTKKGNPKIGNFPYLSGDITGASLYRFDAPLAAFGGELCDLTLHLAAHAALQLPDGLGGYQTETGWGSGDRMVEKGSWATFFSVLLTCDGGGGGGGTAQCETAFAFGDTRLWDILDENGDPITMRWGWQVTLYPGDALVQPIYAGAGQNDVTKGTLVGDLYISYDGVKVRAEYVMFPPFHLEETHLYVGLEPTPTAAPGQYGNQHDLDAATGDLYWVAIDGSPVFAVAHAVVCATVW